MPQSFLSPAGLWFAAAAVLLQALSSIRIERGLARTAVVSAVRAAAQLFVLGWALQFIFARESVLTTCLAILVMAMAATHAVLDRTRVKYSGVTLDSFLSLVIASGTFCLYAGTLVLEKDAWRRTSIILPFAGLLLGNALSGVSLGLNHWLTELKNRREAIEFWLAHGATKWEAARPLFQSSLRTAMIPILNSMTVAGLVSFPGMMTGQLLAGADPRAAVSYQIAALFLISATTFTGTIIAMSFGYRRFFNARHQFQSASLQESP